MLAVIISLAVGWTAWFGFHFAVSSGWAVFWGCLAFLLCQLVMGLIIRRKVMAKQHEIQDVMQDAQRKIERQLNLYQYRQPSSQAVAQKNLEKMQKDGVSKALAIAESFAPLYKWNFLLGKQINVLKIQLLYQLEEYKKVDALLPKALMRDPQTVAICLVRKYRCGAEDMDKFFKRVWRRFKGEQAAFVVSVYAWIKLAQKQRDLALQALIDAKGTTDNAALMKNLENLQNGRDKHYAMGDFGDSWYSLRLEEPKVRQQRRRQMY